MSMGERIRGTRAALRLVLLGGSVAFGGPASAATFNWNTPGTGDWFDTDNWTPIGVPVAGDIAIVNNGGTAEAAADVSLGELVIGRAFGAGDAASGTVSASGNLTTPGFPLFVGTALGADGTTATGALTVGGDLTVPSALIGVALAPLPPPAPFQPSQATGTIAVDGNATLSAGALDVGFAVGLEMTATGALSVGGTLATAGAGTWRIGVAAGGAATGTVSASGIDSTASLSNLFVGNVAGGSADGAVTLGSGDLRVSGTVRIGSITTDSGGTATGALDLGGALVGTGAAIQSLAVGRGFGEDPFDPAGTGTATGSLAASGIAGFRGIEIGVWSGYEGSGVTIAGTATIGAGGIVTESPIPGTLWVGRTSLSDVNNAITGPGATVSGGLSVAGDVSGFGLVEIGTVSRSGSATGTLDLANGTLGANVLRIGEYLPFAGTATDVAVTTDGRLTVTDGAVAVGLFTTVGSLTASPNGATQGELALTRSTLTTETLRVGIGGSVIASEGSSVSVSGFAGVGGTSSAPATLTLDDSTLATGAAAALNIGSFGTAGSFTVTNGSAVSVGGDLRIGTHNAFGDADGTLALTGSSLLVAGNVALGGLFDTQRGRLSLTDSSASVDGSVFQGANANLGAEFGSAILEIDRSALSIAGSLIMDLGAETWFGIGGLDRGLGGYGAIDAAAATLNGALGVDFLGLGVPGVSEAVFDLLMASTVTGDFSTVEFFNLPTGYVVSFAGLVAGETESLWRVVLTKLDAETVPEPAALALLLFGLVGLAFARRRV